MKNCLREKRPQAKFKPHSGAFNHGSRRLPASPQLICDTESDLAGVPFALFMQIAGK